MAQRQGTIRAEISGHGQYETDFRSFEVVQDAFASYGLMDLGREIKELHGDPHYDTDRLTRTECIMILAELTGHATN